LKIQFALFDLLLTVGLAQGVITSILLLLSKKNATGNKFLGLAIISFCLLCIKMLLYAMGLRVDPFIRYFPIGVELLIAPLVYFYVVAVITPGFRIKWNDSIHFIPFILSQTYSFLIFFITSGDSTIAEKDQLAESFHFNQIKNTEDYLALVSIGGYLVAAFYKLKAYRAWLNNTVSDNTYPNFTWLKNIFVLSLVLGVFLLFNLSADLFFNLKTTNTIHWQAYYIFIASLIYYLGFAGYMQPNYQFVRTDDGAEKSKTKKLSEDRTVEIVGAIEKALRVDKVFLNPTINAKDLAKLLGISQADLSYVVNNSLRKNFRDLINDYRIEEVKSKLNDQAFEHMSILGIALECGFNSEASFYRIFKKTTGSSPTEYMHQRPEH
jgi:AraC-like DNA-binding protein